MAAPNYVGTQTGSNTGTSYSGSVSWGSGSNRILVLCIATKGNSPSESSLTSVTLDGTPFTQAATETSAGSGFVTRSSIYYLLDADIPDPSPGTLTISSNNSQGVVWALVEIDGASQSSVPDGFSENGSNSSQGSWSNSSTHSGDPLCIDAMSHDVNVSGTADSGQTERADLSANNGTLFVSTEEDISSPVTMGWTWTPNSNRQAHCIACFAGAIPAPNIETGNLAQGNAGGTTSHTLTTEENRGVLVLIDDESTTQASAVTYNGVNMTLVASSTATTGVGNASSMWFILDEDLPAGGASYNVSVTGLDAGASVSVVELNNVDQVIPTGSAVDTTETGAVLTSDAVATAPDGNSIAVGVLGQGNSPTVTLNDPPTGTGTWTRLFKINSPPTSAEFGCGYQNFTSSGSKTYTETGTGGSDWFRASQILAIFAEFSGDNAVFFGCNF